MADVNEPPPPHPAEAAGERPSGRAGRLRSALVVVWVNLSILLLGLLALDLGAYALIAIRTAKYGGSDRTAAFVNALPADAYADRSWLMTGFHELDVRGDIRWEPYSYWRYQPFSGRYVNIGADGLRRTWNMPAANPLEVAVFGGSTAWGYGARDDYTIPSDLSKMLAAAFLGRVHVTNYGITGYVSTQELITLCRELQRGHVPDVAVFYDGYNDVFSALQARRAGLSSNEYNRAAEFNILKPERSRDFYRHLAEQTSLYRLIKIVHEKLFGAPPLPPLPAAARQQLAEEVVRVLHLNANIVEAIGARFDFTPLFFLQPTPYSRETLTDYEKAWVGPAAISDAPELADLFNRVYAAVKTSALAQDPAFHDISGVFHGQQGTLYVDYAHTTERGNEIIARRIYRDLEPVVAKLVADRSVRTGELTGH